MANGDLMTEPVNGNGRQAWALASRLVNLLLTVGMAAMGLFLSNAYADLRNVYSAQLVLAEQVKLLQIEASRMQARLDQNDQRWSGFWEKYGQSISGHDAKKQ